MEGREAQCSSCAGQHGMGVKGWEWEGRVLVNQPGHLEQPGEVIVGIHERVIVNMSEATLASDP